MDGWMDYSLNLSLRLISCMFRSVDSRSCAVYGDRVFARGVGSRQVLQGCDTKRMRRLQLVSGTTIATGTTGCTGRVQLDLRGVLDRLAQASAQVLRF